MSYYDMLLEHAQFPCERIYVNTRFGDTFAIAAGATSAPTLILLHGSSMNSAMWIQDMQKFSSSFRVIAPDLPGEPGRSVEAQLSFETSAYCDWLADVFDGLSIQRAALMGISLGAWLAIKFAIKNPDRASKLVLLCPAGVGSQNVEFKDIALSLLSKGEAGVDELYVRINGGNPIPEIMLNYQKLIALGFNSRKEPIPMFSDCELKLLTMPSLLFFGKKDILLNAKEATERYGRLVSNSKVTMLPEKGHSLVGLANEAMSFLTGRNVNREPKDLSSKGTRVRNRERER